MSLDPNIFFALPWERHDMGKTIPGTTKLGVTLTANPTIIDGTIATYAEPAIYGSAAKVWTINNNGLISASSEQGVAIRNVYAITLAGGGKITNAAGASIIGYDAGFVAEKSTTIINAGTIAATQGQSTGIALSAGGAVTNSAARVIAGVLVGVSGGSTFSLLNQGVIYTTSLDGQAVRASGTITNAKTGTLRRWRFHHVNGRSAQPEAIEAARKSHRVQ